MLLIRIIKNIFRFLFNCLVVLEKVSEAAEKKTSEWVVKQEQEQLPISKIVIECGNWSNRIFKQGNRYFFGIITIFAR